MFTKCCWFCVVVLCSELFCVGVVYVFYCCVVAVICVVFNFS